MGGQSISIGWKGDIHAKPEPPEPSPIDPFPIPFGWKGPI
jgi:hypothetical protein